jgi:predicted transposase/invertase (TIGR01784 family)
MEAIMKKPPLKMTNDYVFKHIFGDQRNTGILRAFLEAALDIPGTEYGSLTIVDPQLKREFEDDKSGILDVLVHTKSGYVIHVEVQVLPTAGLRERFTFYAAKLLAGRIRRGDPYRQMKRVISLIVMEGILVPEEESYYNSYGLLNRKTGRTFTDLLEINVLELPKLPEKDDGSGIWKWGRLLRSRTEEEYMEAALRDPQIEETVVKVMELSEDERERMLAESREMFLWDCQIRERDNYNAGLAEGRSAGLAEAQASVLKSRLEIARNLKEMGMAEDRIAAATGLDSAEIAKL